MRLLEKLISFVTPYDCLICGDEGAILCEGCRLDNLNAPPSRCAGCLKLTDDYKTCSSCQPRLRAGHIWVAAEYDGAARSLTRQFKFAGAREAGKAMAKSIAEALPYFEKDWVIVPLPTITNHQRMRGFDHTRLIAAYVAQYKQMHYLACLRRVGQTKQVGAARLQRQQQVANTMFASPALSVKDAKILLIDDVMTTGASIAEATRALKVAGAKKVYAAVFAQKVL